MCGVLPPSQSPEIANRSLPPPDFFDCSSQPTVVASLLQLQFACRGEEEQSTACLLQALANSASGREGAPFFVVEELIVRRLLSGVTIQQTVDGALIELGYTDQEGWLWDELSLELPCSVTVPFNEDGSSTRRGVRQFLQSWQERLARDLELNNVAQAPPSWIEDRHGNRMFPAGRLNRPLPASHLADAADALVHWLRVEWLKHMPSDESDVEDIIVPLEMRSFDRVARSRRSSTDLPRIGYRRNSSQEEKEALQARYRPVTVATGFLNGKRLSSFSGRGMLNLPLLTRISEAGRSSRAQLSRSTSSPGSWAAVPGADGGDALSSGGDQGRFSRLHMRPSAAFVGPGKLPETRPGTSALTLGLSQGRRTRLFVPSHTWTDQMT